MSSAATSPMRAGVNETFEVVETANGCVGVRQWRNTAGTDPGALPLVLLHGFTGSSESWRALAQGIARERQVFALDLAGHGATRLDVKAGTHGNCAFAAVSWTIEAALRGLGVTRFALLGYSMGGRIALDHALRRPGGIAGLVLESASPGIGNAEEREARRAADEDLAGFALREGVEAFVDRWENVPVLATQRRLPAAVRSELRRVRSTASAEGLAQSLRLHGTGSMPFLGERLGEIACPVLLVTGALDEKFRATAATMTKRIANARHAVVDGAGHTVHLERADEYARHVEEFLAGLGNEPARKEEVSTK